MAYTAVPTENPGDVLTSTLWNTFVRDNINSGVMRMLADTTLGGSAASIDFTSIPATFAHLLLMIQARSDFAGVSDTVFGRFNGDTAANYDYEELSATNSAASAAETFASTTIHLGQISGASAVASRAGGGIVLIPGYALTTLMKQAFAFGGHISGTTAASSNLGIRLNTAGWRSAAAINRITLTCGGNFVAGSRFTLYGLPA